MNSQDVRRNWAERSGEYSPDYYAYYGPNEASDAVLAALDRAVGRDAAVLEPGCSSGRHLAHLHEHGYDRLAGVDVNPEAFDVMADAYPALAAAGDFQQAALQDALPEFRDARFDAAFSVETLQHVPPDDDWVFAELARVARVVVTVENEDATDGDVTYVNDDLPLYHRDWRDVFTALGMEQSARRAVGRDTLRAFRPAE